MPSHLADLLPNLDPLKRGGDFRLLFFGQLISGFGSALTYVVLPIQMYQLTQSKRLEKGRFAWPVPQPGQSRVTLRPGELALLLNGIDLTQTKSRPWFRGLSAASNSQEKSGL